MFDEFNIVAKSDNFFYDLKIGIAVANLKEIFDTLFAIFISDIVPLDFIDWYEISNLW